MFLSTADSTTSSWAFGDPGALRLEFGQPVLEATLDAASGVWGMRAGFGTLDATVSSAVLGPVLGLVLPSSGITLKGSFVVVVDEHGLHFEGGVGFSVTWPVTVRLPGLSITALTTTIATSSGRVELGTAGSIAVAFGPLKVSIAGLGMTLPITARSDGGGNLGCSTSPHRPSSCRPASASPSTPR